MAPPASADTNEFRARGPAQHFYCGLSEFNPRPFLGVDVKMWLYVVGAVQLGTWLPDGGWVGGQEGGAVVVAVLAFRLL